MVKLQDEMMCGQADLPSYETKENSVFYRRDISDLNPSLMVSMQEDFLPVEGSLLCLYKGVARCNEQMVKLGKEREIKCPFFFFFLNTND